MPMNDPHVKAIHYYIQHDDSVDYSDVEPLVHDDSRFRIRAEKRNVILEPKCHYATEEVARSAAEEFVRRWEFEAALRTQSGAFRLVFERVRIIDRNPPPLPPGVVHADPVYVTVMTSVPRVTVTKKLAAFPASPADPAIDPDARDPSSMLARFDRYRLGREPLASVAYFCLSMLEDSAPQVAQGKRKKRKAAANHYQIDMCVLNSVGELSSEKGGDEARKAQGRGDPFTTEERSFLEAAVTAFIRRAAEMADDPNRQLHVIGMANLPKLPNQAGFATG